MKQLAVVIIILSSILTFFTHMIHEIHYYIDDFSVFYPAVSTYIRFHELTFVLGMFMLSFTTDHKVEKRVLFSLSTVVLLSVVFVQINIIDIYSTMHYLFLSLSSVLLSIYIVLSGKEKNSDYTSNQIIALGLIGFYVITYLYLMLFEAKELRSHEPTTMKTLVIMVYMLYQYGIYQFFKKRYTLEFGSLHQAIMPE